MKQFSKAILFLTGALVISNSAPAQVSPAVTAWLRNTTGILGRHYNNGSSTVIQDTDTANVKTVLYSAASVYIRTNGVPSYITGPFLDGNPSKTTSQNAIFQLPLHPAQNAGTPTATTMGNIGLFINGVALFDARDGASWSSAAGALKGGPFGGMGDGVWNRDAVVAERPGFDCSKGHPANGNYHHHQNPSAFKLDKTVISNVCNLYDADGLYVINEQQHSPLIGFAYDGFPIYGAYAYKNADGSGGIVRMKTSYSLRNITTRITSPGGATVTAGPAVSTTYPLGTFIEDYQYTAPAGTDYLDEHNGRFCVTPEYPAGSYCYFATVDAVLNSAYPYAVGPTFYGNRSVQKVTAITESTTTYTGATAVSGMALSDAEVSVFPNPAAELLAVQVNNHHSESLVITLIDAGGRLVAESSIAPGSTIAYFDLKALPKGIYHVHVTAGGGSVSKRIVLH